MDMPNKNNLATSKDLAVKEMVVVLDDFYQRNFQHMMFAALKHELSVDDTAEAMREALKQWFESDRKLDMTPPAELEDCQSPATEFDLKRLDRDGHLLTIYITAMKNGGPCSWRMEALEDWSPDELIEVLENIAHHYKHKSAANEMEAH